ncbi:MAG TPA: 16S rRNA processing protein RimM [Tenericutes bacterium]|jgi:16S rRNA processing protein RimM|nr:16S rRNA processing protein RimM [Mycoplasmatota bacterium]
MEYICAGYVSGTHGLKGELKIISDIEHKELIFKSGEFLYFKINDSYEMFQINSHRIHKNFELITLKNYESIESVQNFTGKHVYFKRDKRFKNIVFLDELIGMKVYSKTNEFLGTVTTIMKTKANPVLKIEGETKILVPYVDYFIEDINLKTKEIIIKVIEGMIE